MPLSTNGQISGGFKAARPTTTLVQAKTAGESRPDRTDVTHKTQGSVLLRCTPRTPPAPTSSTS
jgi:hypothetical protein